MLERGTLNLLCGGPSAGKTTLTYQAILAHEQGKRFWVSELTFPPGPIVIVNTDRSGVVNDKLFAALGIKEAHFISIVDDRSLHALTRPQKNETGPLETLRNELTKRIKIYEPSTVILDLYGDFISGQAGNHKALGYDGRTNVQWAIDLNAAILGLAYPFKQRASNETKRVQDRIAGATAIQASSNWKFNIMDSQETKTCWVIDCIPPPMGGKPVTHYGLRAEDSDGVGRFHECDPPPQSTLFEIMENSGVSKSTAYKYQTEDLELWKEKVKKKPD